MEAGFLHSFIELALVLLGLVAAWLLGYRYKLKRNLSLKPGLPAVDYFVGINYLLNEEPDEAIDVFINALELNSATLETHQALGTLLRRRGKVDRSIMVYQNLLAWPKLPEIELNIIKIELIKSYIAAGLLDRAERLLNELQSTSKNIKILALEQAVIVYQLEKEWLKAIQASKDLLKICELDKKQLLQKNCSHYYCELTEDEIKIDHEASAREYLKKAFHIDANNVRASLLLGKLEIQLKNYKEALKVLNKIRLQDQAFFSESFILMLNCYECLNVDKNTQKFIQESLNTENSSDIVLAISEFIERKDGADAAKSFLLKSLDSRHSLRLLSRVFSLQGDDNESKQTFILYQNILTNCLSTKIQYKCTNCGFQLRNIHWLCPSCSSWGNVKPFRTANKIEEQTGI